MLLTTRVHQSKLERWRLHCTGCLPPQTQFHPSVYYYSKRHEDLNKISSIKRLLSANHPRDSFITNYWKTQLLLLLLKATAGPTWSMTIYCTCVFQARMSRSFCFSCRSLSISAKWWGSTAHGSRVVRDSMAILLRLHEALTKKRKKKNQMILFIYLHSWLSKGPLQISIWAETENNNKTNKNHFQ